MPETCPIDAPRRIVLMVQTYASYGRKVLEGIMDEAGGRGWEFLYIPSAVTGPETVHLFARASGVIAEMRSDPLREAIVGMGVPVAFVPVPGTDYSRLRREGLKAAAEAAGMRVHVYEPEPLEPGQYTWEREEAWMARWLQGLPHPVGLLVANDARALLVLEACRTAGLRVPDDVAVLGVDNDDLVCRLTSPTLSSIDHGARRIGQQAAALLDRLMDGEPAPVEPVRVQPEGVVERQSTDTLAVADPALARAVLLVRRRAFEGIGVGDILKDVPMSRRHLELEFKRLLGRTPHEEMQRIRMTRAAQLLETTDLAMPEIAAHCGVSYASQLTVQFRRFSGLTPTAYRKARRAGSAPPPS